VEHVRWLYRDRPLSDAELTPASAPWMIWPPANSSRRFPARGKVASKREPHPGKGWATPDCFAGRWSAWSLRACHPPSTAPSRPTATGTETPAAVGKDNDKDKGRNKDDNKDCRTLVVPLDIYDRNRYTFSLTALYVVASYVATYCIL